MDMLKQSRSHLKGAITRIYNFASSISADTTLDIVEVRLERLDEVWQKFCANHLELHQYCQEEDAGDQEIEFESVELKYITAKAALRRFVRENQSVPDNSDIETLGGQQAASTLIEHLEKCAIRPGTKGSVDIELPAIKLAPFSGDYREWPGFRDMFLGSIDCKSNLTSAQKLRYLKSFLRDDAAKLLNHVPISDSNYAQAWERLDRRYNRPAYIISAYIEGYLKLPSMTNADSGHLRKLLDGADEAIRGLAAMKAEGRDPWVIYLLLNKTDSDTRKAWALQRKASESVTIQELLDFLELRCSALEASDTKSRLIKNSPRNHTSGPLKSLSVSKIMCPKCKENHPLHQCPQFLSMSINHRRDFARDNKLCYTCLGIKHSSSKCRVRARCSHCQSRHHTLLHLENSVRAENNASFVAPVSGETPDTQSSLVSNYTKPCNQVSGILPTLVVNVRDAAGKIQSARILLDTGSQVSFVTERLVKRLGLLRRHARLPISGISAVGAGVTQGVVTLTVQSRVNSYEMDLDAYILQNITSSIPSYPFEVSLVDLLWADPGFNRPGSVDILLGADVAWSILRDGRIHDARKNVVAHNTVFGWVVTGSVPKEDIISLRAGADIDVLLKSFWELEEIPAQTSPHLVEDSADKLFANTFSRALDNKYIVRLPFSKDEVQFGRTLSGALARLFALERRFQRDEGLRAEYCQFMRAYEELGHMERIPEDEIEPTWGKVFYLPHHAVVTNKMRVVFNGSCKDSNGLSLNDLLHVGTPLQRSLLSVYLHFRLYRYVFCADIVKMFRQIWVDVRDRDFQRIVWRNSPGDPVAHFRLKTVTYGTAAAPFLAIRVLRQLAKDYESQYPQASYAILHNSYVDDFAVGSDSVPGLIELKNQLVQLLSHGGLELSKWVSNCGDIVEARDTGAVSLDSDNATSWKRVLGLVWDPHLDNFAYRLSLGNGIPSTKRNLLSEVSKIFDPMGFVAPSTILLKILFQDLWLDRNKIGWDDMLPSEVQEKWADYRSNLPYLEQLRIPRRFSLNSRKFDLIGFSDASQKAYAAVVYARSMSEKGVVNVHLIAAKTRVAPIKQLSIPRLELCGALLLSRLINAIRSSFDVPPENIFAFTDSKIVLAWLSSIPRRWNTYIANRTSEILETLPLSVWNHVKSEDNPADFASRGVVPKQLLQLELWWMGPTWLSMAFHRWPSKLDLNFSNVPEERKPSPTALAVTSVDHFLNTLLTRISSWTKLVRVVSFVNRFIYNCRCQQLERKGSYLSFDELQAAKRMCLRLAQEEFQPEIESLLRNQSVPKGSKLLSLSPFIDEFGLLRVGGRIANAKGVPFNIKHPILLPKAHPVSQLILADAHIKFLHAGVSELFSLVRQEFWIIGSRTSIRKIVHGCLKCFRLRQATASQIMGNLPSSRLSPSFPFAHTGCDYAGPITLRSSKLRKSRLTKGYFAIFLCMTTKAMHLEVVSDLSTETFLAALRRFVARRGKCSVIYSDNGTNFRGAARHLSEVHQLVCSKEHNELILTTLAAEGIKWAFIPPHSPHFGGLWEAGVKCVKQHLRRVVGNNLLTFEEMGTLLAQIEALLNSRPLCVISDTDLNPLTPSHFLIGRPYTALPEPSTLEMDANRLGRWELVQNMVQGFWRRWHVDYLTSLQQRPKWQQVRRDFKVGDMVLIKENNVPPSHWALGRVMEVHSGQDGHVRVVAVRTQRGIFNRPITKLALLPRS